MSHMGEVVLIQDVSSFQTHTKDDHNRYLLCLLQDIAI